MNGVLYMSNEGGRRGICTFIFIGFECINLMNHVFNTLISKRELDERLILFVPLYRALQNNFSSTTNERSIVRISLQDQF